MPFFYLLHLPWKSNSSTITLRAEIGPRGLEFWMGCRHRTVIFFRPNCFIFHSLPELVIRNHEPCFGFMLSTKRAVDGKIYTLHELIKDKHHVSFSNPVVMDQKALYRGGFLSKCIPLSFYFLYLSHILQCRYSLQNKKK